MKSYIEDLCGDEDQVVIDSAILECVLQEAIYTVILGKQMNEVTLEDIRNTCKSVLEPYAVMPTISVDFKFGR